MTIDLLWSKPGGKRGSVTAMSLSPSRSLVHQAGVPCLSRQFSVSELMTESFEPVNNQYAQIPQRNY